MESYLLIVLNPQIGLSRMAQDSPGRVTHGGVVFDELDASCDDFLGFYDWQRSDTDDVLGVRVTLHAHALGLRGVLSQRPYVEWDGDEIFCVRFASERINAERSLDQEFSVARAYGSADGQSCLLFDAVELTLENFAALGC